MANFTITISDSLNVFGGGPSTKWGTNAPFTMVWNTSKWGENWIEVQHEIAHVVSNTLSPTPAYIFDVTHDSTGEALTFDSTPINDVVHVLSETLSPTSETTSEGLLLENWSYTFPKPTAEAESRAAGTWTEGTEPAGTWTSSTAGTDGWSEA